MNILGVVMAGGRNTRYGGLKAFADVGGRRIIDRVVDALRAVTSDIVIIANDADAYRELELPMRADSVSDGAALAGLLTALRWASERHADGIMTVACDMPFANGGVLRTIAERAPSADVVAPESGSRRGIEPLCAFYSTACIPAIQSALDRGDLRMVSFHDDVRVERVPLADVSAFGDPEALFMNVNTPEEHAEAQRIAAERRL